MNDQEPEDTAHHKCPMCGAEVAYLSMAWHTVRTRSGEPLCRRMGRCPGCGKWLKPIFAFSDEGDNLGGMLLEVDSFESDQVKGQ
jgi:uncharacterized protein (UPF0212 family)